MAIDFQTFNSVISYIVSAKFPVLIRGRHGIGKSELVYQTAKDLGLPVVERRLVCPVVQPARRRSHTSVKRAAAGACGNPETNGGYVATNAGTVHFLRESSQMYIYSNPITVGEAAAALCSVEIVDSPEGIALLERLRDLTQHFEQGLDRLGIETIPGEHPVVPLMIRDTERTKDLVSYLYDSGVLVTGLTYPVVPRGDEEIRTQINADHTKADIDHVLGLLEAYR